MSTELATIAPNSGVDLYRTSTDAAGLCKALVVASSMKIQGRAYVRCEGWQAIAVAHGCVASARDVEKIEGGIRALGEVRRMSDGTVIATAEGFVGDDEKMWAGRPMFARRAMAQTRAISRACRSAFAHVVVMMNAGLQTTPAEEMEGIEDARPAPAPKAAAKDALDGFAPAPAQPNGPAKAALPDALKAKARTLYDAIRAAETAAAVNDLMAAGAIDLGAIKAASADAYDRILDLAMRRERETAEAETGEVAA